MNLRAQRYQYLTATSLLGATRGKVDWKIGPKFWPDHLPCQKNPGEKGFRCFQAQILIQFIPKNSGSANNKFAGFDCP